eukprot:GEMP01000541.1.p1 GENE.GEMP01000541.1~~GEMP01000541.1.p1  ORF type:complete len:1719 (+),score=403.24 GEMP01000541.1:366-5522(+)
MGSCASVGRSVTSPSSHRVSPSASSSPLHRAPQKLNSPSYATNATEFERYINSGTASASTCSTSRLSPSAELEKTAASTVPVPHLQFSPPGTIEYDDDVLNSSSPSPPLPPVQRHSDYPPAGQPPQDYHAVERNLILAPTLSAISAGNNDLASDTASYCVTRIEVLPPQALANASATAVPKLVTSPSTNDTTHSSRAHDTSVRASSGSPLSDPSSASENPEPSSLGLTTLPSLTSSNAASLVPSDGACSSAEQRDGMSAEALLSQRVVSSTTRRASGAGAFDSSSEQQVERSMRGDGDAPLVHPKSPMEKSPLEELDAPMDTQDQFFALHDSDSLSATSTPRSTSTPATLTYQKPSMITPPPLSLRNHSELETMSSPSMRQNKQDLSGFRRQTTAPGGSRHLAMTALEVQFMQGRQLLTDRALEYLIGGRNEIPKVPIRVENVKTQWGKEWIRLPQLSDGTCQICYEQGSMFMKPCGNIQCSGQYCRECLNQTALSMIEASLYACPYLKCPECRNRVPTVVWRSLVPEDAWEKYCTNARALLNFRCPDCDEVGSLLLHQSDDNARSQMVSAEEQSCWVRWGQDVTSVNLIETIVKAKIGPSSSMEDRPGDATVLSPTPGAQRHFYYLLLMVDDIERRCTLLLQWLRRFPYFKTPCCEAKMCFKCKTQGWHPGHTCEERMRKTLGSGAAVQWCPKCGVPTVKSEGCDHIVCCCGASWTWMRSSLLYAAIHGLQDHLLDALGQQSPIIKVEVETDEELQEIKRITDSWRICHEFRDVPVGAELLRARGTSCEGLTNIAYLMAPCHLWFRPRQEAAEEEEEEEDEEEGSRAIAYAAIAGSEQCVRILLDHGYDPNHTSYRHSHTPLCAMVTERSRRWGGDSEPTSPEKIATSCLLVSAKADINLVTNYGETPLTLALQEEFCPPEYLDWLLDNSDFAKVPGDGLFHCLLQQQPEYPEEEDESAHANNFAERFELRLSDLVTKLSEKKADINQTAHCGETPLMLSCERGLYTVAGRLIDNNASVEPPAILVNQNQVRATESTTRVTDTPPDDARLRALRATRNEIHTPSTPRSQCSSAPLCTQPWQLHVEGPLEAALRANCGQRPLNYNNKIREQLVLLLLEHGARADRLGVLNQAVSQSGVPIGCVELLLQYKACVNTMDAVHTLPLFAALEAGHTHMANLLLEQKAEINLSDSRYRNIFHVIATGDYTWESELPWDSDTPPDVPTSFLNARDSCGHTPLAIALRNMMSGVTAWLLNLNADPNERVTEAGLDGQTFTPLAFAIRQRGSAEVCRSLLSANAIASDELLPDVLKRCDEFASLVINTWPLQDIATHRKTELLATVSNLNGDSKEEVMRTLLEAKGEPNVEMFLLVMRNPTKCVNACCRLLLDYRCEVNEECLNESIFRGHANVTLILFQRVPPYPMVMFDICQSPKLCEKDQLRLVEAAMGSCNLSLRDAEKSLCCTYAFERKRWTLGLKLVDTTDEQLFATVTNLQEKRTEELYLRKTVADKKRSYQTLVDLISEAQINILHNQALFRRLMPSWTMVFLCAVVLAFVLPKEMQRVFERFQKVTYWWERPSYLANQVGGIIPKNAFEKVFRARYWNIIERPFHSSAFGNSIRNFDLANVPHASVEFVTALRRRMTPQQWHSVTSTRGRNAEALLSDWLRCVTDLEERHDMKPVLASLRRVGAEVQQYEQLIQCRASGTISADAEQDSDAAIARE